MRADLEELAERYETDEVLIVSMTWDHQARLRSYELVAKEFGMTNSVSATSLPGSL